MDLFSTGKPVKPDTGDLLISEPYLMDRNFNRTVILLCKHSEAGTIGFVLNKSANIPLADMVDETGSFNSTLYVGGPVEQNTLHFIHRHHPLASLGSPVMDNTYWGGDYLELLRMMNTRSIRKRDIRFFVGYSGWSAGQLADEIRAHTWIVMKHATPEMIFDWDNQNLWKACLRNMGGKFKLMANYPVDPRSN